MGGVIWQSKNYNESKVVSIYAMQYANGEVKFLEINEKGRTIRICWEYKADLSKDILGKLTESIDYVLISGLTLSQRECGKK